MSRPLGACPVCGQKWTMTRHKCTPTPDQLARYHAAEEEAAEERYARDHAAMRENAPQVPLVPPR